MEVKTGDKFGARGWWVNKNLDATENPLWIEDPEDEVPGKTRRLMRVFI